MKIINALLATLNVKHAIVEQIINAQLVNQAHSLKMAHVNQLAQVANMVMRKPEIVNFVMNNV